eukprot:4369740-Prorocentrum_lima.AAC.1
MAILPLIDLFTQVWLAAKLVWWSWFCKDTLILRRWSSDHKPHQWVHPGSLQMHLASPMW